ncbi:MAG TPA: GNAT family N-acetyltransferase [Pseudomonadales bacterium]|nr:GNAT family N-acetyltransferase [Pseudomonadales bacterium]
MLLKRLRLAALKDSPNSFTPTFEEISLHGDDFWHDTARQIAENPQLEVFVADDAGEGVGLVSGEVDDEGVGHIVAMWASPVVRGKGVGRLLMNAVTEFLRDNDCDRIELSVTETNQVAINLYKSMGFVFTGQEVPLREGSDLMNLTMARAEV